MVLIKHRVLESAGDGNDDAQLDRFDALRGPEPVTELLRSQLHRIAATHAPVLIEGEHGTGKRLAAREIVRNSSRVDQRLLTLECGGEAPADLELELFGCERGFSTTRTAVSGALEDADGGTLIIDEIAALPLTAQARLLRAIETGTVQRIGDPHARHVDVRIIAITNADLWAMCERREFRRDLYYCLRTLRVRMPPLRERLADLPALVEALAAAEGCEPGLHLDQEFLDWLRCRRWPGNLRELRNVLLRVRLLGQLEVMNEPDELPAANVVRKAGHNQTPTPLQPVAERMELAFIVRLLRQHNGNVIQSAYAAHRSSSWLRNRISRYKIDLREFRGAGGGEREAEKAAG